MEKEYVYEFAGKVRYSEIDHRGRMTLPALINYFQDSSIFHSESVGRGMQALREEGKAWVLSYWQVIVHRYPKLGETVVTGTFATGFKGFFGNRNFYMNDGTARQIACANSVWVFIDLKTGRPCRPASSDIAPYGQARPLDMVYEDRKIILPDTFERRESFPVRKYHIDTNEHVNNCQYVQMAMEMLPGDLKVRQLRADYKKSALLGNRIYPEIAVEKERNLVRLCDGKNRPYAIVEVR